MHRYIYIYICPGEWVTLRGREMGQRLWLFSCPGSPPVGNFCCSRP